jgi:hypothetical protein
MTTDISVTSTAYQNDSRGWLLGEAVGHGAPTLATDAAQIDWTGFTAGTHYPNGFIPSGIVLALNTVTNKLVAYVNAGANGTGTAVGFLYNAAVVPTNTAQKSSVAYVRAFAAVSVSRLPANNGLDTAARTALKLIDFRA